MVYYLKHMAVRFWFALLTGGMTSLWVLTLVPLDPDSGWIPAAVGLIVGILYGVFGWVCNRLGLLYTDSLIREAVAWERSGAAKETELAYSKAMALLDSFILSPRARKRGVLKLGSHLCRLYLSKANRHAATEGFIADYLMAYPEDGDVAETWLRQVLSRMEPNRKLHDLAACIGDVQKSRGSIQRLLAQLYLSENRTDFTALQTYRRLLQFSAKRTGELIARVAGLFVKEGRADEWALEIYLRAARQAKDPSLFLQGIAACVHGLRETENNRRQLHMARKLMIGIDEKQLSQWRSRFKVPLSEPFTSAALRRPSGLLGAAVLSGPIALFGKLSVAMGNGANRLWLWMAQFAKAPGTIKWALPLALSIGFLLVLVNTFSDKFSVQTPEAPAPTGEERPLQAESKDPFTLQVAAYLKAEQARRFQKYLNDKGYEAYINQVNRNRKQWYQVRLSHFPTKASAVAYGESLKAKGVIDDFYVANYQQSEKTK